LYQQSFDFIFCANFLNNQKLIIKDWKSIIKRKKRIIRVQRFAYFKRYEHVRNFRCYLEERYQRLCKYNVRGWNIRFKYIPNDDVITQTLQGLCQEPRDFVMGGYYLAFWRERVTPTGKIKLNIIDAKR